MLQQAIQTAYTKQKFMLSSASISDPNNPYLIVFIHVSSRQYLAFTILLIVCIVVSNLKVFGRNLHALRRYLLHVCQTYITKKQTFYKNIVNQIGGRR